MQQLTVVFILSLAIFVSALSIAKPQPDLAHLNTDELTVTIRRLKPHEVVRGNLYHLYKDRIARLTNETEFRRGGEEEDPGRDEGGGIDLSSMVNIGKDIWDIIVKNQPTSDVKTKYGAAVPKGIDDWHTLTGWKQPYTESYSIEYTNVFQATVVKFEYTVAYIWGGKYKNTGQFLTGVQIIPNNVEVLWGYNFACTVEIPQVLNVGDSVDDPLAAVQLTLAYTVETVVNKNRRTKSWFIKGNGEINEV